VGNIGLKSLQSCDFRLGFRLESWGTRGVVSPESTHFVTSVTVGTTRSRRDSADTNMPQRYAWSLIGKYCDCTYLLHIHIIYGVYKLFSFDSLSFVRDKPCALTTLGADDRIGGWATR
jgi:hypothetical protein